MPSVDWAEHVSAMGSLESHSVQHLGVCYWRPFDQVCANEGAEALWLLLRLYWFQANFSDVIHGEPPGSWSVGEEISVRVELLAPAAQPLSLVGARCTPPEENGRWGPSRCMEQADLPSPSPALPAPRSSLLIHLALWKDEPSSRTS